MSARSVSQRRASTCRFCERYGRSPRPVYDVWDTVLDETAHFVVVPTKGALVTGWLLVVPKQHVLSLLELNDDLKDEFGTLIHRLRRQVEEAFSIAPTVFEHGPTRTGTAFGCGIDHAHAHVVPLGFDLVRAAMSLTPRVVFAAEPPPWRVSKPSSQYLCVLRPDGSSHMSRPDDISSQFFRRAIASALGTPHIYDYEEYPQADMVSETVRVMRQIHGRSRYDVPATL